MARKDGLFDRDAFCPFYHGTRGQTAVCCEGPYKRSFISITFKNKAACTAHRERFCNGKGCAACRIYKCVMQQYEEGEHATMG